LRETRRSTEAIAEEDPDFLLAERRLGPLSPGLYLVSTPIGNLEDMTLRGIRVLHSVDHIACEDTRQTGKLLQHFGISKPLSSCHEHNEQERAIRQLLPVLTAGGRVALVSDAGMPGISDPGMLLVRAAIDAGVQVFPIPGANAALTALIASGLSTADFIFHGFLPEKAGPRRTLLEALNASGADRSKTHIFYEAPHRILETLGELVTVFGERAQVVVARELTKLHEEFLRGTAGEILSALAERERVRGEMVLLLQLPAAGVLDAPITQSVAARVQELQNTEQIHEKEALKRVARERGLGKSDAYRELQREKAARKH
jgi:16S rRNA (cytidine1402-2'-O)-methyltransferase